MILQVMLTLESGIVVGSIAVTVSIIGMVGKNLNRKFDEKADKNIVEDKFRTNDDRFKEMNDRINQKAEKEMVEKIFKSVERIDNKMDKILMNKK